MKYTHKASEIQNSDVFAKKVIFTFKHILNKSKVSTTPQLLARLHQLKHTVVSNTKDPITKNATHSILYELRQSNLEKTKNLLSKRIDFALNHLYHTPNKIAELGYKKIKKGMVIYVSDFSPFINSLLLKAKAEGINFEVVTTEANPFCKGFLIAAYLAKHNISVKFYSDLALRQAIKKADLVLLDADVLSKNGKIYSEIGSELIADLASKYDVPIYVCTDSWKLSDTLNYEEETRLRPEAEIWKKPPKGVTVLNYGYEKINPHLISGIITEIGIYKPSTLVSEIKKHYPWI